MKRIGYADPMRATSETYKTTNIMGGPGYDPQGKKGGYGLVVPLEVAGMSFAPFMKGQDIGNLTEHFYDTGVKIVNRKKKAPYNAEFNNVRREPGFYPLNKPGPAGYGNQVERANWVNMESHVYEYPADLIAAMGILDRQTAQADMPHQWLRAPVEQDHSQRMLADFFEDLSSRELQRKVQDLEAKGYGAEEIRDVIMNMRRRDIEKGLSGPSHEHMRYEDMRDMYTQTQPQHDKVRPEHAMSGGFEVRTRYKK